MSDEFELKITYEVKGKSLKKPLIIAQGVRWREIALLEHAVIIHKSMEKELTTKQTKAYIKEVV